MSGIVSGQQIKIPNGETAPAAKWVSLNTSSQRLVGMRSARSPGRHGHAQIGAKISMPLWPLGYAGADRRILKVFGAAVAGRGVRQTGSPTVRATE